LVIVCIDLINPPGGARSPSGLDKAP
jgi:hypothetical protein